VYRCPVETTKEKQRLRFATQMLVDFNHFFLQHQIDRQWQMTAFCMPNNNGNGTIEIT
jgi:hypothetical protein